MDNCDLVMGSIVSQIRLWASVVQLHYTGRSASGTKFLTEVFDRPTLNLLESDEELLLAPPVFDTSCFLGAFEPTTKTQTVM